MTRVMDERVAKAAHIVMCEGYKVSYNKSNGVCNGDCLTIFKDKLYGVDEGEKNSRPGVTGPAGESIVILGGGVVLRALKRGPHPGPLPRGEGTEMWITFRRA
jgi:hypothetical protein